jgi:transcriptional regulator with XRE-family HTH domain
MNVKELSLHVKEKRGSRGVREVAKEIGISIATLSRIESGKQPDLQNFTKICRWLGIEPNTILGFSSMDEDCADTVVPSVTYAHLRADREMSPETVQKLADLIMSVQKAFIIKE